MYGDQLYGSAPYGVSQAQAASPSDPIPGDNGGANVPAAIDATKVPPERRVVFEGSKRVVSFEGSIRKVRF